MLWLAFCLQPQVSHAVTGDPLLEGALLCTRHLPRYEREYGIPTHLLSAIASTESGRWHSGLKIKVPWPWSINAEGKGYVFGSKQEAIAAVKKLRSQGVSSIDVGCMQVNLHHHPEAFRNLEQAFEPQNNIAYAAGFLRELYQEGGSWKKAAANYHSRTPTLGSRYVGHVYDSWRTIVDKLRQARLQTPQSGALAMRELGRPESPYIRRVEPAKEATPARLPEQKGKKVAAYQAPRMNSIKVASAKENGVVVVRPQIRVMDEPQAPHSRAQPFAVAQAALSAPEAKVVRVDTAPRAADGKKSGPNFIFE